MKYYLDCEFDGYGGRLISMALVADDGGYMYWADADLSWISDEWVKQNVVPIVALPDAGFQPQTYQSISAAIESFFPAFSEHANAHIIADWPDDVKYFCQAMITGPGQRINTPPLTFEVVRHDAYPSTLEGAVQHNALWDALALRHLMRSKSA